ncbi:MAG: acyltransferase protein [Rhodoferax sp.]|nr:acyltransferase protein [Rhodoferax sp.]
MDQKARPGSYIASLDGIRAIAVLIVFVFHSAPHFRLPGGMGAIPGGFGVTIFFFLSGYLITTLLRQEFDASGKLSIRNFYIRRAYRILPPLYIFLFVLFAIQVFRGLPVDPTALASQIFQWSNYYVIFNGDSKLMPATVVTWSLAVEEHFYLVYPVLMAVLMRRFSARQIAALLVAFCVAILVWRCVLVMGMGIGVRYTYMATDTRLDAIAFGALAGFYMNPVLDESARRMTERQSVPWFVLGLLLVLASFGVRNETFRETFRYSVQGLALWPLFFCAIKFAHLGLFSWLNTRLMRWLGTISYTFYLIHWSVLSFFGSVIQTRWVAIACGLVGTAALAQLMYVSVERPLATMRKRRHGTPPSPSIAVSQPV